MSHTEQDPEEVDHVLQALHAADSGSAGHWPTVAGVLADEVRRLREQLAQSQVEATAPTIDVVGLRSLSTELRGYEPDSTEWRVADFIQQYLGDRGAFRYPVTSSATNRQGESLVYGGDNLSSLREALSDWWGQASEEEKKDELGRWVWAQLGLMADIECGDLGGVSDRIKVKATLTFEAALNRNQLAEELQALDDRQVNAMLAPAIAEQLAVALQRANMTESLQDISVQATGPEN